MKDEIKHALRLARAFGGMTYEANNIASGMSDGGTTGRVNYQMGGMPMGAPNQMGAPGMMTPGTTFNQNTINTGPLPATTLDANLPPPQPTQAPVPGMPMNTMSGANPAGMAKGGAAIWNKPRPKSLGKPKHLTPEKKSKAKAMAKAAGRPYPNMIDNMRAAKDAGGAADRKEYMIGGMPTRAQPQPQAQPARPAVAAAPAPQMQQPVQAARPVQQAAPVAQQPARPAVAPVAQPVQQAQQNKPVYYNYDNYYNTLTQNAGKNVADYYQSRYANGAKNISIDPKYLQQASGPVQFTNPVPKSNSFEPRYYNDKQDYDYLNKNWGRDVANYFRGFNNLNKNDFVRKGQTVIDPRYFIPRTAKELASIPAPTPANLPASYAPTFQQQNMSGLDNTRKVLARSSGGAIEDALRLARDGEYRLHQTIARHGYATDGSVAGSITQQPDYEREDVGNILNDLGSRADVNQTVQEIQGMTPPPRMEYPTTPAANATATTPHATAQTTPAVPSPEIEDYARMGMTPPAEGETRGPMSTLRPGELTSHGSTDMRAHYQWTPKHNAVDETLQMMRQKHADGGEVKQSLRLAKKSKKKVR